jgi:hypothetical protein
MPDWRQEMREQLAGAALDPGRARELCDEIAQHLDDRYAELVAGGMAPAAAEATARAELEPGGVLAARLAEVLPAAPSPAPVAGAGGGVLGGLSMLALRDE